MKNNKDYIDFKPIQLTTPENSRLTYGWLVKADDKYPPARWQVTVVVPASEEATNLVIQLDDYNKNFKRALKQAYTIRFPDLNEEQIVEKLKALKWNPLPWSVKDHDELGLKDALILRCNKKTHDDQGTPKAPPIIFDSSQKEPLNDEQKQKYEKIGPGTTGQVALYVSQYNLGVGTGIRLTPAAVNIKNFIPFGSQAQTAEEWGFKQDVAQQAGSGTPSTNDFDF